MKHCEPDPAGTARCCGWDMMMLADCTPSISACASCGALCSEHWLRRPLYPLKTLRCCADRMIYRSYDHVIPPFEGVPSPEHPCHVAPVCQPAPPAGWQGPPPCLRPPCTNGTGTTNYSLTAKFDFRRLGTRSAAMLISPYVKAGSVFGTPRGKFVLLHLRHHPLLVMLLLWCELTHVTFRAAVSRPE